jgi:hypothetical protein
VCQIIPRKKYINFSLLYRVTCFFVVMLQRRRDKLVLNTRFRRTPRCGRFVPGKGRLLIVVDSRAGLDGCVNLTSAFLHRSKLVYRLRCLDPRIFKSCEMLRYINWSILNKVPTDPSVFIHADHSPKGEGCTIHRNVRNCLHVDVALLSYRLKL